MLNTAYRMAKALYVQSLTIHIMGLELTEVHIKLINLLDKFFRKANGAQLPLLYSTGEVFTRLQSVWPSEDYTTSDVYQVLIYLDYEWLQSTNQKITWLIRNNE